MLTAEQLRSICKTSAGKTACGKYVDALNACMAKYGIDSPVRVAAFLAQIAHESADFTRTSENLNYSADGLANTWRSRYAAKGAKGDYLKAGGRYLPNDLAKRLHRQPEAIANNVYAGRMGNGPESSGDGWNRRGRGLKQLTGTDNYRACSEALGVDFLSKPDLLETPLYAVMSACWFWKVNGLGVFADRGDFEGMTIKINGGTNGLAERVAYHKSAIAMVAVRA